MPLPAGQGSILSVGTAYGSQNAYGYLLARISAPKIQNSVENISSSKNTQRTKELVQSVKSLSYKYEDMGLHTQNPAIS